MICATSRYVTYVCVYMFYFFLYYSTPLSGICACEMNILFVMACANLLVMRLPQGMDQGLHNWLVYTGLLDMYMNVKVCKTSMPFGRMLLCC